MSFNPKVPSSENSKFTYETFTLKTFVDLIGTGSRTYCQITAPNVCRGNQSIPRECDEIFQRCVKSILREEAASRLN
jgi:hypothetical protein